MGRTLKTETLDGAAQFYAHAFAAPDAQARGRFITGPSFVMEQLYKLDFKDEFDYVMKGMREWMAERTLKEFDRRAAAELKPRDEAVLQQLLADKLAIDMDGGHIDGKIGSVVLHGQRLIGTRTLEVEAPESIRYRKRFRLGKEFRRTITKTVPVYWPIYAGEPEERIAGSGVADEFPPGTPGLPLGALNTRISNEIALLMCDAAVDQLDEGTGAAIVRGYTTAQPANPDVAVSGQTLLFTLVCSDPAFGAAADAAPGGTATASAITDDTSADATATLAWCRASATNDGATPLDDHIDGEAGTSGADFNFNTLSIVSGATISLTSWTVTQPET